MFRQGFTCPALLKDHSVQFTRTGLSPSMARPFQTVPVDVELTITGLVRVRSPLLAESRLMSFPAATEMFQFAAFASSNLSFQIEDTAQSGGFPHSETPGSMLAPNSPGFFAGCHVLHRLCSAKASTKCPSCA